MGHASKVSEIRTSELDAVSLLFLTFNSAPNQSLRDWLARGQNLFKTLEKCSITSLLIAHFAKCESESRAYSDPSSGKKLFMKGYIKDKRSPGSVEGAMSKTVSVVSSSDSLITQYRLSGGMSTFHNIVGYDADFFPAILKGINDNICKITRLDMCIDFSEDIMGLVSDNVKKGRVSSFGSNLKGYGYVNGNPFSNEFVGRRSSFYNQFKEANCKFSLQTLYCGHPRNTPCVLVFYDKRLESSKNHVSYLDSTRVLRTNLCEIG